MKKAIRIAVAVAAVAAAMGLGGCGSGKARQAGQKKSLKIGVALIYKGDEWLAAISDEFEKQGKELGYRISVQDGGQENEKQIAQIENFIAQKYDAIVVSAASVEGILPAIDKAAAAKIPVIAIDTPIQHPHVSTCIAWDNYETGVQLGAYVKKYVQERFADKKEVNVVMINAPAYPHLVKRDEGFLSVLMTDPRIKVIASQDASGSRETSANIINNNIAKGIDVVYGVVDNHAWGAVTALEEAKAAGTAVFSCGGFGDEPFGALAANHPYYKALVVVPPKNIVSDSFACIAKILAGEKVDPVTNIKFGLADASTVSEYK